MKVWVVTKNDAVHGVYAAEHIADCIVRDQNVLDELAQKNFRGHQPVHWNKRGPFELNHVERVR